MSFTAACSSHPVESAPFVIRAAKRHGIVTTVRSIGVNAMLKRHDMKRGEDTLMRRWRAGVCLCVALALNACAINLTPEQDILLAGTEDERDNALGRLVTEHGIQVAFSLKTRRESNGDSATPSQPSQGTPEQWQEDPDAPGEHTGPQRSLLSSLLRLARRTLDHIGHRFTRPASPSRAAPVLGKGAVSLRALPSLRCSADPIVFGPWSSEVGYELLYWIPFLRWVASEYDLPSERIIAVSRGGAASWYGDVASRYVDVFAHVSPDEYRARLDERFREAGHQKQYEVNQFDRTLIDVLNLEDAYVLHPSVMYQLLRHYWNEKAPVGVLTKHTHYSPLPDPGDVDRARLLPKKFVAVRFYFRPSFPDTPENRQFALRVIRRLARRQPVVILNTGFQVDDHEDLNLFAESGIYRVDEWMSPTNNLALQSQIISRADAFVGTYGGLSYLGPYYRVPTTTFYSEPGELVTAHVDATWRLCQGLKSSLTMLNVRDAALIASSLGGSGS
jgi:hypothetical protein